MARKIKPFEAPGFSTDDFAATPIPPPKDPVIEYGQELVRKINEYDVDGFVRTSIIAKKAGSYTGYDARGHSLTASLIGMEEFKLAGAALNSLNGDITVKLRARGTERYTFIDADIKRLLENFSGGQEVLTKAVGRDIRDALVEMHSVSTAAAEKAKIDEAAQEYGDDYGAW